MLVIYKEKFIERLITSKKVGIQKKDDRIYFKCEEQNCIFNCAFHGTCKSLFKDC